MNPQKLAGQCGKLKCCLNFEVDTYLDAQREYPPTNVPLDTEKIRYIFQKADILDGIYWYSAQNGEGSSNLIAVHVSKVKEIQQLNSTGKRPEKLIEEPVQTPQDTRETFQNMAGQESINRFDKSENVRKRKKNSRRQNIHRSTR